MAIKYLDYSGLSYFWGKIKTYIDAKPHLTIDDIYPVDSIYMSVNSTNPGTLFPGTTWEKIEDKFLLAAGSTYTSGSTGGAATVTLTSAQSGVPVHQHGPYVPGWGYVTAAKTVEIGTTDQLSGNSRHFPFISTDTSLSGYFARPTQTGNNTAQDASAAHENMPPYLAVNIWKRTA